MFVLGVPIEYCYPNINDVVIENTKRLGVHISLGLNEENYYFRLNNCYTPNETIKKGVLTKECTIDLCLSKILKLKRIYKDAKSKFDST